MQLLWKSIRRGIRERVGMRRDFLVSRLLGPRRSPLFESVETFCVFLGTGRSGHSLVGALIDAHPDAVVAHELHVLKYIARGFTRTQIFFLLMKNAERVLRKRGRVTSGYNYHVPGQWQGRFRELRLIGDKKGGGTAEALRRDMGLLEKLKETVGVPIRCVHVLRNPYDNIATLARRFKHMGEVGRADLEAMFDRYFRRVAVADDVKRLQPFPILDVRQEDLIEDPRRVLRGMCEFLGLEPHADYIDDCASIIISSPHKSRHKVEWPADLMARVAERIATYDFLAGYSFDS